MTHRPFLPSYLLQPFDIKYLRDDLHAIAFFQGHDEYEAVEAMLCLLDPLKPKVRAILTRHDQSQIDFVNYESAYRSAVLAGREAKLRNIDSQIDLDAKLPKIKISFESARGEQVLLEVVCASPPDASRGGVSDPGRHSVLSSLPVTVRGKSALASAESRVEISGVRYRIPETFRAGPHFVAHHSFFTQSHHMALLRAGERSFKVLSVPQKFNVGEAWVYEFSSEQKTYEIQSVSATSEIAAASISGGYIERVKAMVRGEMLEILEISVHPENFESDGATLRFSDSGSFSVGVDANNEAIVGSIGYSGIDAFRLRPQVPAWAVIRNLNIGWLQQDSFVRVNTSITSEPEA